MYQGTGAQPGGTPVHSDQGDRAYRRAWWCLALYPLSFVAAFVIGEGVLSILTDGAGDPSSWEVVVAATPALIVFVVPGVLAVVQGRAAMRLGRPDGRVPALVGAAIGVGFVGVNLAQYVAGLILG